MDNSEPLCLVIMPFGKRKDATGRVIDFDAVYQRLVLPAVQSAGLSPVRSDELKTDGVLHRALFERLMLCEYALADLTAADAGVFYQLGVRQAVQPQSAVLIWAAGSAQVPFYAPGSAIVSYRVSPQGLPVQEARYRRELTERLEARETSLDSPPYRLVADYPQVDKARREALREQLEQTTAFRRRLAEARQLGGEAVKEVEVAIGNIAEAEPGLVIDLLHSYRAVRWWNEMIDLVPRMSPLLSGGVLVQEQLALALNWARRGEEAEARLREVIASRGGSSESYGKLGGILKHRWEVSLEKGESAEARELLDKAVGAYLKGFEADWQDTYCGLNAVILMELKSSADPRRRGILPVVRYAVEQRIRSGAADYWDFAAGLLLAVLSGDEAKGLQALPQTVGRVREAWEPETTVRSLRLIREARLRRGAECPSWAEQAEAELQKAAARWARP